MPARRGCRAQRDDAGEVIGVRKGMFGASGGGDTTGYGGLVRTVRLPGASAGRTAALRRDRRRTRAPSRSRACRRAGDRKTVVDRGELTFHIEREHLVRVARTLRDDPALRFELCTASAACTTRATRAASCTPCTTCARSPTAG